MSITYAKDGTIEITREQGDVLAAVIVALLEPYEKHGGVDVAFALEVLTRAGAHAILAGAARRVAEKA